MKHRTFGVEIECGFDGGTEEVARLFQRDGGFLPNWSFGYDGSGVEARTPVLSGPRGFKELRRALNLIRKEGGFVTERDGLHVHHGVPEIKRDVVLARRLVQSWSDNTKILDKFVAARRHKRISCPHWSKIELDRLFDDDEISDDPNNMERRYDYDSGTYRGKVYFGMCGPRGSLNLWSLNEHGTVELRFHEGTLDADIAEAWVRFGQRFINTVVARKTPLPALTSSDELLKRVKVGQRAAQQLLNKSKDPTFATQRRQIGG